MSPLIAIYNPVCGNGSAKAFFDEDVLPLLNKHGKIVDRVVGTENAGHAGTIVADFIKSVEEEVTLVLGSGDGTLHEIINFLSSAELKGPAGDAQPLQLNVVLVPCGTANALYSSLFPPTDNTVDLPDSAYKLQSVQSYIGGSKGTPLTLAITTLSSPPYARKRPRVTVSAVVVSTALHASILHDSESLRQEIPGIERFKVAAENNSTKWYNSYVKLLPGPSTRIVQVYDPITKTFIDHPDSSEEEPIVDLYGPFAYFLSTVNADRLEPAFRITPLTSTIPPTDASCDIVVLRPLRDPSLAWDNPEARTAFAQKLWTVLGGAYENGAHVDLRYDEKGDIVSEGSGPTVIEYIRCGGWEWVPDDIDEGAHLLCSDGAITHIEKGGRAVCSAAKPGDNAGFLVHV